VWAAWSVEVISGHGRRPRLGMGRATGARKEACLQCFPPIAMATAPLPVREALRRRRRRFSSVELAFMFGLGLLPPAGGSARQTWDAVPPPPPGPGLRPAGGSASRTWDVGMTSANTAGEHGLGRALRPAASGLGRVTPIRRRARARTCSSPRGERAWTCHAHPTASTGSDVQLAPRRAGSDASRHTKMI